MANTVSRLARRVMQKKTSLALVESQEMVYPCADEMNGSSQIHS